MKKIEHIGIVVKNLADAEKIYNSIFNSQPYKSEVVVSEKVTTSFYRLGDSKIELLESLDVNSAIGKFIARQGEGLHHIAFAVSNIEEEILRLKAEGFTIINEVPKKGADNKLVCFVHPKDACGVLIEICQEIT